MAIENVAGETAGQTGQANVADLGAGRVEGDNSFALPNDFDANIDDGIEISDEPKEPSEVQPVPVLPAGTRVAPTAQPAAQPGAQPVQPVAAPAQPAQTPVAQPVGQPAAQPAGQTPDSGAATERRIYSPGELAQQLGRNKDTMIEALATQKFQLSPAEREALEVDAVGVLPKIMARVYFEATVNGLQQLANMVPRMVEHVANERLAENSAETDFHTEWPNIDRNNPVHMKTVAQLAASYRQMNPNASQQDAVKFVGMAATNFLGLQMPQRNAAEGQRSGNGAIRRPNPAFAPATGGRAQPPAGTPTGSPGDAFAGLGLQFDDS